MGIPKRTIPGGKKRKVNVTLNYTPISEKYKEFHRAGPSGLNIPTRAVKGGVGVGKSIMCLFEVVRALLCIPKYAGKKAIVAGVTAQHLREHLLPETLKILSWQDKKGRQRGLIEGRDYVVTRHPTPKIVFSNQSTILFVSAESKENLRSFNVSIIMYDDAGPEASDSSTFDALVDRAFRESDDCGFILLSMNPVSLYSWQYKRWWSKLEDGTLDTSKVALFSFNMYDNIYLKHKWAITEQQYKNDPVGFKRRITGDFCSQEGLVYSNFDPNRHVLPRTAFYDAIRDGNIYQGVDFGGVHATAMSFVSEYKGKYYVFQEYWNKNPLTTISQHCDYLKRQQFHVNKRFSDIYTETVTSYRSFGIRLELAEKGNGAKRAGIALINELLEDNRLFISEDCVHIITEMNNYSWLTSSVRDVPKEGDEDTLDSLRYCIFAIAGHLNRITSFFATEQTVREEVETPPNKLHTIIEEVPKYIKELNELNDKGLIFIGIGRNNKPIYAHKPPLPAAAAPPLPEIDVKVFLKTSDDNVHDNDNDNEKSPPPVRRTVRRTSPSFKNLPYIRLEDDCFCKTCMLYKKYNNVDKVVHGAVKESVK